MPANGSGEAEAAGEVAEGGQDQREDGEEIDEKMEVEAVAVLETEDDVFGHGGGFDSDW